METETDFLVIGKSGQQQIMSMEKGACLNIKMQFYQYIIPGYKGKMVW